MKVLFFFALLSVIISCNNQKEDNDITAILKEAPYESITDSIKKFPEADTLYFNRGLLLTKNKLYEPAFLDFEKAWSLKQNEDNGVFLGASLINLDKFNEAVAHFVKLTSIFPDNLVVRERLGFCFEQIDKPNEAINQYDYILKKDSSDFITMATKAYALQSLNNDAEAIKWFEKSYALVPNKTIGNELVMMYAVTKNNKTIALSDKLIQSDSSDMKSVQPIYAKGLYYKNTSNYALAVTFFDQCIREDYTFPYAYLDKAVILYEQKKYIESIKILEIAKQNDNQNSEVYYRMGRCLEALGNKNGAILEYERALALDKDYTVAKEALEKLQK